MNNRKYIINSLSYMTIFNVFSMFITAFLTFLLPKFTDVVDYSLWQLFMFYYGYLGFFHLGWNDGIYIKYGGYKYEELNKISLFSQFWIQIVFQLLCAICVLVFFNQDNWERRYILYQLAINIVILNSRYMLIYVLQATARIKEYALILFCDRIIYLLIIIGVIVEKSLDYKGLIISETIGKIVSYILAIYYCKDIVINNIFKFRLELKEIMENINSGIKIMFSNIASILIIGISRYGIEKNWSIEIFGQISLSITISQLFITFVTNIGMIIFPLLRKMKEERLLYTYQLLKIILNLFILFIFIFFYVGRWILIKWIPSYSLSIKYMGLLLPICFYESEMALLNNPYLKNLRKEKTIMYINVGVMLLGCLFTAVFSFLLDNLTLSVISITILIGVRCICSEYVLNCQLKMGYHVIFNLENLMIIIYVITSYSFGNIKGFLIYLISYSIYISIVFWEKVIPYRRKDIN